MIIPVSRKLAIALAITSASIVGMIAAPAAMAAHCSPVANAPTYGVNSYGGLSCPGGSSHSVGFNLYLLACSSADLATCGEADNIYVTASAPFGSSFLTTGNTVACTSGYWYRSRVRIAVTGATSTSGAYQRC